MRVLRKLTLKSLKMNRMRTVMTVIGIVLSIALITVITGMAISAWQSSIQMQFRMSGDYDIQMDGAFDEKDIAEMTANRHVRDVYAMQVVGVAKNQMNNTEEKPYIKLMYMEEKTLAACSTRIAQGRFPQNDSELLLSSQLAKSKDKTYQVGDTVTLSVGKRYFAGEIARQQGLEGQEIEDYIPYMTGVEEFRVEQEKTYTIVGILESEGGFLNNAYFDTSLYAYTGGGTLHSVPSLYIRLTDEAEKNYLQVMSELTGVKESMIQDFQDGTLSQTEAEEALEDIQEHNPHIMNVYPNRGLLTAKGYYVVEGRNDFVILLLVVGFVLLFVMAASVFIIRNSFAISVTEKTRLYGMLSSVGATPRQIRANVYFEAAVLGLMGIPIGILLGVGATGAMVGICNALLDDILTIDLIFWMPWYTYVSAVILGMATIFFSAYASSHTASRISPMEAIRSSKEIRVGKRQRKESYKTPKFIKKLFGVGGSIAWKNMKRSRRQYRTTVLSIIISVSIYLTAAAFVNYNIHDMESQSFYKNSEYNMQLDLTDTKYDNDDDGSENDRSTMSAGEFNGYVKQLTSMDGIKKFRLSRFLGAGFVFPIDESALSEDVRNNPDHLSKVKPEGNTALVFTFCAVDDATFEDICRMNGKTMEECKDKGFITNKIRVYAGDYYMNGKEIPLLAQPEGTKLHGSYTQYFYEIEEGRVDEFGDPVYKEVPNTVETDIEIGGVYPSDFVLEFDGYTDHERMIVSMDWYEKNILNDRWAEDNSAWSHINMMVDAEKPDELTEELQTLRQENKLPILNSVTNYARIINNLRSMILLMQIFIYGFILVIVLIGVTNIFNTITTNMKLRQKEFAMLSSIGTTKREFNRMIHLECLLYTMKSLLIGVPIGLFGNIGIHWLMNLGRPEYYRTPFMFPWAEILLCVFVVLFLLLIIMRFSIAKVSKQNIIETIRNDNI